MKQNSNFMFVFALVLNLWSINANALEHICNRWNVLLDNGFVLGPIYGDIWTDGYKLQGDTTINNMHYSCLQFADGHKSQQSESGDWVYHGAIRETANAEVYFVPSGQSKEYLLFAFNAQVGDKIENLYVMNEDYNTWAIVKNITEEEIILDLYEQFDENENIFMHDYVWVKGVGAKRSMFQPLPNGEVGGNVVNFLLCAYNNEKHIYISDAGEKYGCDYRKPLEVSITQASTWYGIRYVHDYPQKEHTPLITNITYKLEADTIIGSKKYRQIRYTHEYENIINAYRGAIRQSEDGQQVYYIPWGSNNEYLLYNFDVKQGDIVHAYAGFNDISCEEMAEPGRSIIPAWTVMSVQTIDGRKHIFVQDEEYGTTIEWIEGIGTQYILWPFGRTCYSTGLEVQFHHALCAADNEGNILYSFNTDDLGIRNECPNWQPMAIEHIHSDSPSAVKTLHDGHILILRGDKTYTLTGQEVK